MACVLRYFTECHVCFARTSLHCAAANNSVDMCKFLINNGACVFAVTAIEGKTPSRCCERECENFDKCLAYLSGNKTKNFRFRAGYQLIQFIFCVHVTFSPNDRQSNKTLQYSFLFYLLVNLNPSIEP